MTVLAVSLVSWKSGRNYGSWHIERGLEPLCGRRIPQSATVSRRPGLLKIADMCERCLYVFSLEPE